MARLDTSKSVATRKMLTSILVQIHEFGKKGENFLKSWGVTPLTIEDIERFKADDENWPYLQGGYYVGLTGTVEYMNAQENGSSTKYGAAETVSQIATNLGLGKQCSRVVAMGAISDSMFICVSAISLYLCMHIITSITESSNIFYHSVLQEKC